MSRIIEDVPVAEARRRLAPAYGGSWDEAAAGLMSGRFSAATVEALVDEYQRDGGFETPVLWANDEDGVDRVLDGMHRMAAASLVNGVVGLHEGWLTRPPRTGHGARRLRARPAPRRRHRRHGHGVRLAPQLPASPAAPG